MIPTQVERDFFRLLNAFVEPAVRAGLAGPCLVPWGLIVIETVGRRTGRAYRTPLLASRIEDHLLVSTFRPHSRWVRNAESAGVVRYWVNGREGTARAIVIRDGAHTAPPGLPRLLEALAADLFPRFTAFGWTFVILEPITEVPAPGKESADAP
ncbi:nitroreductase/quinone reductase family protein [Tepidiforma sp.]|uniref:nitroreductase/quinone reductase family protein n=1 Tax=Tepidiforma sp. TaxID=2682230 RepID=UPI002ADDE9CF|nr:nitroreductase/quinone reductase family protein [Tepidiforma sp.]